MGAIGCMWLGSRRAGHALLSALAYPAMGLLLLTLVLAYSRGALAALMVGPRAVVRRRAAAAARRRAADRRRASPPAPPAAWDFKTHALSAEAVPLAQRTTAGHQLGVRGRS